MVDLSLNGVIEVKFYGIMFVFGFFGNLNGFFFFSGMNDSFVYFENNGEFDIRFFISIFFWVYF